MAGSLLDEVLARTDDRGRPLSEPPIGPAAPSLLDTVLSLTDDLGRPITSAELASPQPRFTPVTPETAAGVFTDPRATRALAAVRSIPAPSPPQERSDLEGAFDVPETAMSRRLGRAAVHGVRTSAIGTGTRAGMQAAGAEVPPIEEIPNELLDRTISGLAEFATDIPIFMVGGGLGGLALRTAIKSGLGQLMAHGLTRLAASEKLIAATKTALAGAGTGAGALGLEDAVKAAAKQAAGESEGGAGAIITQGGKGVALGGLTFGVGSQVPPGILRFLTEAGIFGAAGPPIHEGRLPTVGDLIEAGVQLGAIKAAFAAAGLPRHARRAPGRVPQAEPMAGLSPEAEAQYAESEARLKSLQTEADRTLVDIAIERARLARQAGDLAERHAAEIGIPQARAEILREQENRPAPAPAPTDEGLVLYAPGRVAPTPGTDVRSEAAREEVARLAGAPMTRAEMEAARFPTVPETVIGAPPRRFLDLRRSVEQANAEARATETGTSEVPRATEAPVVSTETDSGGNRPGAPRIDERPLAPGAAPGAPTSPEAAPTRPGGVGEIAPSAPRVAPGRQRAPIEEPQTFDPTDFDQLANYVLSRGGVAPSPTGDLKGEYDAIPLRYKSKRGLSPDRMAEAVTEESGQPIKDWQILDTLAKLTPKRDVRARMQAEEARHTQEAAAAANMGDAALIGEIARRNAIPESEARARLARGAEPPPPPTVPPEPPPEFLPPEVLASDVATTIFEGWKAGESSPARKRALDFRDWAEEVIDGAGSLEEARRIVQGEPEGGSAETPGRRGVPAMRLTKAQQLAILDGLFPEEVSHGNRPEAVGGGPGGVPGGAAGHRAEPGAASGGTPERPAPAPAAGSTAPGAPTGVEPRPAVVTPRFERTPEGDQALIPGAEARRVSQGPIRPSEPQADVTETPLFGQERVAREGEQIQFPITPEAINKIEPPGPPPQTVALETGPEQRGRPEPPLSSAEGGFLRLGPRKKVETPTGTGLAEINEMTQPTPVKRGALERVRAARTAITEAMTNRFEGARIIDQELKAHGLTRPRGEGIVQQLEIMPNAIRGNIYRDMKPVGEAYRRVYDAGLEDQLTQYLTLKQFERTIDVLATRHANDPGAQVWRRGINADTGNLVNPRGFDLTKTQAELQRLDQQFSPAERRIVEAAAKEVWAVNRKLLDDAHTAGVVNDAVYNHLLARGEEYVPRVVLDYLDAEGRSGGAPRGTHPLGQTILRTLEGTERDLQEPMAATIDRIPRVRAQIEKNRARRMITDLAPQLPGVVDRVGGDVFRVPDATKSVISAFEDGERVNYSVPVGVERALTYLDAQQVGFIEKFLRIGGTPLKAGATGMNVGFAVTNVQRDIVRLLTFFRYGVRGPTDLATLPVDFVRGFFTAIHTNVDSVGRLTERVAPGISARADALADQYYRSGAAFSTVQRNLTGEDSLRSAARLAPKREPWAQVLMTPVDILKALVDGVATFNKIIEDTPKLTGQIRAMRAGASSTATAYEVANFAGSPNFARAGTVGASLALLWMFYNARLQGTVGDVRRMTELPAETALKIGLFTVAPGVALWLHNRQFDGNHGREDITDNDQNRFWYILRDELYQSSDGTIRRKYYKIAKEESAQALWPVMEGALDWLVGADPPSVKKLAVNFGMNVLPFSNIPLRGEPTAGNIVRTFGSSLLASANPWIGVPIGVGFNYDPYTQGPVVPRGLEEHTLPQEQVRATTSATMIRLGNILGVAPIKLEWAVNKTTGGLGQSVLDALDKTQGKELPAVVGEYERQARLPGFSRVLGRGGDQQDRDIEDRFWQVLDEARRIKGSMTAAGERQGNVPRAMELATSPDTQAKLAVVDDLESISKDLSEMRQAQVFITHYLEASVDQKRESLRALAESRHQLLATFREIETMTKKFTRLPGESAAPTAVAPASPGRPTLHRTPLTARDASEARDLATVDSTVSAE